MHVFKQSEIRVAFQCSRPTPCAAGGPGDPASQALLCPFSRGHPACALVSPRNTQHSATIFFGGRQPSFRTRACKKKIMFLHVVYPFPGNIKPSDHSCLFPSGGTGGGGCELRAQLSWSRRLLRVLGARPLPPSISLAPPPPLGARGVVRTQDTEAGVPDAGRWASLSGGWALRGRSVSAGAGTGGVLGAPQPAASGARGRGVADEQPSPKLLPVPPGRPGRGPCPSTALGPEFHFVFSPFSRLVMASLRALGDKSLGCPSYAGRRFLPPPAGGRERPRGAGSQRQLALWPRPDHGADGPRQRPGLPREHAAQFREDSYASRPPPHPPRAPGAPGAPSLPGSPRTLRPRAPRANSALSPPTRGCPSRSPSRVLCPSGAVSGCWVTSALGGSVRASDLQFSGFLFVGLFVL